MSVICSESKAGISQICLVFIFSYLCLDVGDCNCGFLAYPMVFLVVIGFRVDVVVDALTVNHSGIF